MQIRATGGSVFAAMLFHASNDVSAFTQNISPDFSERVEYSLCAVVASVCAYVVLQA